MFYAKPSKFKKREKEREREITRLHEVGPWEQNTKDGKDIIITKR